jgi:hypothetical protein
MFIHIIIEFHPWKSVEKVSVYVQYFWLVKQKYLTKRTWKSLERHLYQGINLIE